MWNKQRFLPLGSGWNVQIKKKYQNFILWTISNFVEKTKEKKTKEIKQNTK